MAEAGNQKGFLEKIYRRVFQHPMGGARLEKNYPRISRIGTDDPSKLGLAEKSKNLASPLEELFFWFCPIRGANVAVPAKSPPCSPCPLWLNFFRHNEHNGSH